MVQMLRRLLKSFGKPASEPPRQNRLDAMLEGARESWMAEVPKSTLAPLPLLYRHAIRAELAEGASAQGLDEAGFDRFADAWCALLAENARLPESLQIPEASIHLPRNLLLAYFGDQSLLAREAQSMLRYVEAQFGAGGYAQVEILLRLFETEAITQRNNERNIFFERSPGRPHCRTRSSDLAKGCPPRSPRSPTMQAPASISCRKTCSRWSAGRPRRPNSLPSSAPNFCRPSRAGASARLTTSAQPTSLRTLCA
jgi:hypothetical protein